MPAWNTAEVPSEDVVLTSPRKRTLQLRPQKGSSQMTTQEGAPVSTDPQVAAEPTDWRRGVPASLSGVIANGRQRDPGLPLNFIPGHPQSERPKMAPCDHRSKLWPVQG